MLMRMRGIMFVKMPIGMLMFMIIIMMMWGLTLHTNLSLY